MNNRFTVLVLVLGFPTWIPAFYAFGQKTDPVFTRQGEPKQDRP